MDGPLTFNLAYAVVGSLLILVSLSHSYIARWPLSAAMLYLLVGWGMGPHGLGLLQLDVLDHASLLERLTEAAVIVSLFVAGMKLDLPLSDRRWRVPLMLASVSMVFTVAALTAVGVYLLHLPWGLAVLLGAVLAPTDPVLASDVQMSDHGDRDRLRFGLTGEGGLNDGSAFPFVMLGLGLLGHHELGEMGWRWWLVDVVWATLSGLGIGWALGSWVGRAVLHLRLHHREVWGADEFISLGLIALAYGVALLCAGYGFLAVFAAGLALGRKDRQRGASESPASAPGPRLRLEDYRRTPHTASPMAAVQRFNRQLERVAEVGVVLAIGALLATVEFQPRALWFVAILFLIIRPTAVWLAWGLAGKSLIDRRQVDLMAWFGIRGIGSVYYLMYAIGHGLSPSEAELLVSITITVVVASVTLHGISVTPLMRRYEERKQRSRRRAAPRA